MTNERLIQQEITRAENKLKQLRRDLPRLEALAAKNTAAVSNLEQHDSSDFDAILEARMRANTADQMLASAQAELSSTEAQLESLTAELDQAALTAAHAAAEAEHEQAMAAWYKQAAQSVRIFKAELDKLTRHAQRAGATARAAKAAAEATGVNYASHDAPPMPSTQFNWLKVDGVESVGHSADYPLPGITTDYMQLNPPTFRTPKQ